MQYIQIDNFNGNINIICKDDGSGEPQIFDSLKEAQDTLEENCQNGQIVPLGIDPVKLLADFIFDTSPDIGEDELPTSLHWSYKYAKEWFENNYI